MPRKLIAKVPLAPCLAPNPLQLAGYNLKAVELGQRPRAKTNKLGRNAWKGCEPSSLATQRLSNALIPKLIALECYTPKTFSKSSSRVFSNRLTPSK